MSVFSLLHKGIKVWYAVDGMLNYTRLLNSIKLHIRSWYSTTEHTIQKTSNELKNFGYSLSKTIS